MTARELLVAMALLAGIAAAATCAAWAKDHATDAPPLHTDEAEIGEASRPSALAIDDPLAVFSYVLGQLPPRVQVYPTENYFYFRFVHNGVPYAGNIRLAAADRDRGNVDFSYNERPSDWNSEPKNIHAVLGGQQGVGVEKIAPLTYRVSHAGKSVVFALNDLSKVAPPPGFLKADEKYLGPVFDESGIRFFFVFNSRLRIFHFILDESAPAADQFAPVEGAGAILLGKRTGFAFYNFEGRKILVGADRRQSRLNTYFDGPFDQLPENFIEGEALREAIVASEPSVKGQIDRLGYFSDGSGRFLIHPYMLYRQPRDLAVFHRCSTSKAVPAARRAACFVIDDDEAQRSNPRPLAMKRR